MRRLILLQAQALQAAENTAARTLILDITGVPVVDSADGAWLAERGADHPPARNRDRAGGDSPRGGAGASSALASISEGVPNLWQSPIGAQPGRQRASDQAAE